MAAGGGPLPALVGQPGLPDPGRAVYQQARVPVRAQGLLEDLELRAAADQRPPRQRDRHSSQHASSARVDKRRPPLAPADVPPPPRPPPPPLSPPVTTHTPPS